jgi:hypothetical protein
MTNTNLIAEVRTLHNALFDTNGKYRSLMSATPEINVEGNVFTDELEALKIMRERAVETHHQLVAVNKLAHLSEALHAILLTDGLGGSLAAGREHVETVRAEIAANRWEIETSRRIYHGKPPLSS